MQSDGLGELHDRDVFVKLSQLTRIVLLFLNIVYAVFSYVRMNHNVYVWCQLYNKPFLKKYKKIKNTWQYDKSPIQPYSMIFIQIPYMLGLLGLQYVEHKCYMRIV